MANDLHIFLSEEEFARIRVIAKREDRSVSNLARVYIRQCLAADVATLNNSDSRPADKPNQRET